MAAEAESSAASASEASTPRIEFEKVARVFSQGDREVTAVEELTFTVGAREFVSIIGPSGCGKSTAPKLISGLDRPTRGRVLVDGREVTDTQPKLGFMLQRTCFCHGARFWVTWSSDARFATSLDASVASGPWG